MYGSKPINVYQDGRRFGGWWLTKDGVLEVCSAYGSRVEPVGRRKHLEERAKVLLADIVQKRTLAR